MIPRLVCLSCALSTLLAAPDNDNFSNRTPLNETSGTFDVYQLDATREPSEPRHTSQPLTGYGSVWWTWTAPADGILAFTGDHSDYSMSRFVAIYTGDTLSTLQQVAADKVKKYVSPLIPSLLVPVRAGEPYQIAVSFAADAPPDFSFNTLIALHFEFYPPPANDFFASRTFVAGDIVPLKGYTVGATREPGEPPHGDLPLNNSVWWQWTPPEDGIVLIEGAALFPGILRPYIGSEVSQLIPVPLSPARDSFEVHSGQPVQLAVAPHDATVAGPVPLVLVLSPLRVLLPDSTFPDDENGNVTLLLTNIPQTVTHLDVNLPARTVASFPPASSITLTNLPPGAFDPDIAGIDDTTGHRFLGSHVHFVVSGGADLFSDARDVAAHAEIGGDFSTSTIEPGEPPLPPTASGSVWWRWTALADGVVRLENTPSSSLSRDVFTGSSVDNLQVVPYQNNAKPADSFCTFNVRIGAVYYIRLYQTGALSPWASTLFHFLPLLPNDYFANAEPLSNSAQIFLPRGITFCEPNEPDPCAADAGSRWYRFIPPVDGAAFLNLHAPFGLQERTAISVYTGDSLANLSQIFPPQSTGSVPLNAGAPYFFRIETPNSYPETLNITFHFDFVPRPPNDNIADAILMPTANGVLQGTCDVATTDPAEFLPAPQSVWYRFIAPEDGALALRLSSLVPDPDGPLYEPYFGFVTNSPDSKIVWDDSQFYGGSITALKLHSGQEALLGVWKSVPPRAEFLRSAFQLEHFFVPRPPNDDFTNRTELTGAVASATSSLWNASHESEPNYGGTIANRSVWFKWLAPADGVLNLRVSGGDFSAFTGTNLFIPVDSFTTPAGGFNRVQVSVTRTNWYNLRLSTSDMGLLGNPFDPLHPETPATATLDLRFSSIRLASPTNQSVFPARAPINFQMAAPDTNFDPNIQFATVLMLTNPAVTTQPLLLAGPLEAPFQFVVSNFFPALHTFQILVTNAFGEPLFSAPVQVRIAPLNDSFTNATPLFGENLDVETILSGSSTEPKEGFAFFNHGSVWYNWRPIAAGPVHLHFIPRPYTADVQVLTGNTLTNLKLISRFETPFNASPASNYFIRVTGPSSDMGTLLGGTLQLRQTTISSSPANLASLPSGQPISIDITTTESPDHFNQATVQLDQHDPVTLVAPSFHYAFTNVPPGPHQLTFLADFSTGEPALRLTNTIYVATPNDSFTNRVLVPFVSGQISGSTYGATSESGVPYAPGDVWYQWTAPADGLLLIGTAPPVPGISAIALYQGDQLTNLVAQPNRIDRPFWAPERGWQVRSNQSYLISVIEGGEPGVGADFNLELEFRPTAPNDAFTNRIALFGSQGEVDGNLTLATTEPDEPPYPLMFQPGSTAWWTWTPPSKGLLEISYPGMDPQNRINPQSVVPWRGDALPALKPLPPAKDLGPFPAGFEYYRLDADVPLQLSLAAGLDDLVIPWAWRFLAAPSNDDFVARTLLTGHEIAVSGTTLGATLEPNEPFVDGVASTWWTWTSDSDADLWITVTNAGAPLRVEIFTGSDLASLQLFTFGQSQTALRIPVRAGTTYQFMISPEHLPGADYQLGLALGYGTLLNDNFKAAQPLDPTGGSILADNSRATREFHEPLHAGHFGGRSLWYTWNAQKSGTLELGAPSVNHLLLAAYTGDAVTNLQEIASTYIEQSGSLKFRVQAGQQYRIALDNAWGYGAETLPAFGQTQLNVTFSADLVLPSHFSAALSTDGTLILTADSGQSAVLETTTDFRQWIPVQSTPTAPLTWKLTTDSEPARFFRLRTPP